MNLVYLVIALVTGSIGSVALAGLILILNDRKLEIVSTYLMYLAGGTLLGSALLGMIPKAAVMSGTSAILQAVLAGILFFFLLEKVVLWRSCRSRNCERHLNAAAPIILIGDAFHNAMDGVVIAAGFLTSVEVGVFVTLSVFLHEIPQELSDLGILIKSNMSRMKALGYNMVSGATAIFSGIISYYALDAVRTWIPYALAFSAASFLYIALADLIPEMHRKTSLKASISQIVLILTGIAIIVFILVFKKLS